MMKLLSPMPYTAQNIWEPGEYPGWMQDLDPTALGGREQGCDYCSETSCLCLSISSSRMPQLRNYGDQVLGLQAIAAVPGKVAYARGAFIGTFTGQIVPPGSFNDPWTHDLRVEGRIVCQIRAADIGNCFRALRGVASPSACLVSRRRGGKYVLAVEALQDIEDGQEITIQRSKKA